MSVLAVRAALANLNESETHKNRSDLPRLEDGNVAHELRDLHGLRSDELPLELWCSVLKQHRYDFFEVLAEFVECGALRVGARSSGNVADEQPCGFVTLYDRRKALHEPMIPCEGPPNKPLQRTKPPQGLLV